MKPYLFKTFFVVLVLMLAVRASAQTTDYTYQFEASSGQSTYLNGSTLTIQDSGGNVSIIGWDIVDKDPSIGFTVTLNSSLPSTPTYVPGSPGSFSAQGLITANDITAANATGFSGYYNISNYVGSGTIPNLSFLSVLFDNGAFLLGQKTSGGFVSENDTPSGTWQYVSPVPEADSCTLLAAGIGAAELLRRRLKIQFLGRNSDRSENVPFR